MSSDRSAETETRTETEKRIEPENRAVADSRAEVSFHEMCSEIRQRNAVIIVGTGVSVQATKSPVASWGGLLKAGRERLQKQQHTACSSLDRLLHKEASANLLIAAAGELKKALGGGFAPWMRDQLNVSALAIKEGPYETEGRRLIQTLCALDTPLFTTNYDLLLSHGTGRKAVSWRDTHALHELAKTPASACGAVLHLHGLISQPESLVFDADSYAEVRRNRAVQNVLRAIITTRTLIFVGMGAGLTDPNLGYILSWYERITKSFGKPSYVLVTSPDEKDSAGRQELEQQFPSIRFVEYDQAPFLRPKGASAPRTGDDKYACLPAYLRYMLISARGKLIVDQGQPQGDWEPLRRTRLIQRLTSLTSNVGGILGLFVEAVRYVQAESLRVGRPDAPSAQAASTSVGRPESPFTKWLDAGRAQRLVSFLDRECFRLGLLRDQGEDALSAAELLLLVCVPLLVQAATQDAVVKRLAEHKDWGLSGIWSVLKSVRGERANWTPEQFKSLLGPLASDLTGGDVAGLAEILQPEQICALAKVVRMEGQLLEQLADNPLEDLEQREAFDRWSPRTVHLDGAKQRIRPLLLVALLSWAELANPAPMDLPDSLLNGIEADTEIDFRAIRDAKVLVTGGTDLLGEFHAACLKPSTDCALADNLAELNAYLSGTGQLINRVLQGQLVEWERDRRVLLPVFCRNQVRPLKPDLYFSPAIKVSMAPDRIQDLLMGDQLWGDRRLTFRELYQNALDACRFRRNRTLAARFASRTLKPGERPQQAEYVPVIWFHQDVDPLDKKKLRIECWDNGIGMDRLILERCFARAGGRSIHEQEIANEISTWEKLQKHPDQLKLGELITAPVSRFGIGVFSYFLVAHLVEIQTCRLNDKLRPGSSFSLSFRATSNFLVGKEKQRDDYQRESEELRDRDTLRNRGEGLTAQSLDLLVDKAPWDAGTRVVLHLKPFQSPENLNGVTPEQCDALTALNGQVFTTDVHLVLTETEAFARRIGRAPLPPVHIPPRHLSLAAKKSSWVPREASSMRPRYMLRRRSGSLEIGSQHTLLPCDGMFEAAEVLHQSQVTVEPSSLGLVLADGIETQHTFPALTVNIYDDLKLTLSVDRLRIRSYDQTKLFSVFDELAKDLNRSDASRAPDEQLDEVIVHRLWTYLPKQAAALLRELAVHNTSWNFAGCSVRTPTKGVLGEEDLSAASFCPLDLRWHWNMRIPDPIAGRDFGDRAAYELLYSWRSTYWLARFESAKLVSGNTHEQESSTDPPGKTRLNREGIRKVQQYRDLLPVELRRQWVTEHANVVDMCLLNWGDARLTFAPHDLLRAHLLTGTDLEICQIQAERLARLLGGQVLISQADEALLKEWASSSAASPLTPADLKLLAVPGSDPWKWLPRQQKELSPRQIWQRHKELSRPLPECVDTLRRLGLNRATNPAVDYLGKLTDSSDDKPYVNFLFERMAATLDGDLDGAPGAVELSLSLLQLRELSERVLAETLAQAHDSLDRCATQLGISIKPLYEKTQLVSLSPDASFWPLLTSLQEVNIHSEWPAFGFLNWFCSAIRTSNLAPERFMRVLQTIASVVSLPDSFHRFMLDPVHGLLTEAHWDYAKTPEKVVHSLRQFGSGEHWMDKQDLSWWHILAHLLPPGAGQKPPPVSTLKQEMVDQWKRVQPLWSWGLNPGADEALPLASCPEVLDESVLLWLSRDLDSIGPWIAPNQRTLGQIFGRAVAAGHSIGSLVSQLTAVFEQLRVPMDARPNWYLKAAVGLSKLTVVLGSETEQKRQPDLVVNPTLESTIRGWVETLSEPASEPWSCALSKQLLLSKIATYPEQVKASWHAFLEDIERAFAPLQVAAGDNWIENETTAARMSNLMTWLREVQSQIKVNDPTALWEDRAARAALLHRMFSTLRSYEVPADLINRLPWRIQKMPSSPGQLDKVDDWLLSSLQKHPGLYTLGNLLDCVWDKDVYLHEIAERLIELEEPMGEHLLDRETRYMDRTFDEWMELSRKHAQVSTPGK